MDTTPLTQEQWDLLTEEEGKIYRNGGLGITDVTDRTDESVAYLGAMWEAAASIYRDTAYIGENADGQPTGEQIEREAARRVAVCQAILAFGTDCVKAVI